MQHPALADLLDPVMSLYTDVRKKSLMRLEYEGLSKCEAVTAEGARWHGDPAGFAMERYAYYVCFKCGKAYFGGEARCDLDAGGGDAFNPEELVCGGCSDVSQAQMCPKHGTDYLEYKCRYCCSVAVFFCFGTTHFCNVRAVSTPVTFPPLPRPVTTTSSEWRIFRRRSCRSARWRPRRRRWSRRTARCT